MKTCSYLGNANLDVITHKAVFIQFNFAIQKRKSLFCLLLIIKIVAVFIKLIRILILPMSRSGHKMWDSRMFVLQSCVLFVYPFGELKNLLVHVFFISKIY